MASSMFVLTVLIFWGADKRSVGDLFSTLAMRQAALARHQTAGHCGSRVPESTSPLWDIAGSHKTHCHGIAAEAFLLTYQF